MFVCVYLSGIYLNKIHTHIYIYTHSYSTFHVLMININSWLYSMNINGDLTVYNIPFMVYKYIIIH